MLSIESLHNFVVTLLVGNILNDVHTFHICRVDSGVSDSELDRNVELS